MTRRIDGGRAGDSGPGAGGDGGTDLSPWRAVASMAELDAITGLAVAGVRTVNAKIIATETNIIVDAGERWVLGEAGTVTSPAPGGASFIFDVDAPAISGPVDLSNVDIRNNNAGASSWCVDVITTLGRIAKVIDCVVSGIRGIRKSTVLGVCVVQGGGVTAAEIGFQFSGTVGPVGVTAVGFSNLLPGAVAIEVLDTAVFLASPAIQTAAISIAPGQFGFAIAENATFNPGALFEVGGPAVSGVLDDMFRQDVGDMSIADDRLLVFGAPENNWSAVLDASRVELADPLIVAYPAINTPTPIPYWTGAGVKIAVTEQAHWQLVIDDPGVGDMYLLYTGVKRTSHRLSYQIFVDRNAGTDAISLVWETESPPGSGTWIPISSTETFADNTNAFRTQIGGGGDSIIAPGARIRPSSTNLGDDVAARIYQISLAVSGV